MNSAATNQCGTPQIRTRSPKNSLVPLIVGASPPDANSACCQGGHFARMTRIEFLPQCGEELSR